MSGFKRAPVAGGRAPRKDPLASLKMASMMDTKPVLPAGNYTTLENVDIQSDSG